MSRASFAKSFTKSSHISRKTLFNQFGSVDLRVLPHLPLKHFWTASGKMTVPISRPSATNPELVGMTLAVPLKPCAPVAKQQFLKPRRQSPLASQRRSRHRHPRNMAFSKRHGKHSCQISNTCLIPQIQRATADRRQGCQTIQSSRIKIMKTQLFGDAVRYRALSQAVGPSILITGNACQIASK